jgi:peroxin-10
MALPLLYRLFPRSSPAPGQATSSVPALIAKEEGTAPPTPGPVPAPEDSVVVTPGTDYDAPNTYLTEKARELPERQCSLCLEPRGTGEGSGGTVAVTECGHIFCWGCLGGLDKMECPLCRQALRMERLVAAYNL